MLRDDLEVIFGWDVNGIDHRLINNLSDRSAKAFRLAFQERYSYKWHGLLLPCRTPIGKPNAEAASPATGITAQDTRSAARCPGAAEWNWRPRRPARR